MKSGECWWKRERQGGGSKGEKRTANSRPKYYHRLSYTWSNGKNYHEEFEHVDCEQSRFCSKIRGEKVAEHESRASGKAARLPPRALLVASPLARDSRSATFPSRIFEQKRDCSQSIEHAESE